MKLCNGCHAKETGLTAPVVWSVHAHVSNWQLKGRGRHCKSHDEAIMYEQVVASRLPHWFACLGTDYEALVMLHEGFTEHVGFTKHAS